MPLVATRGGASALGLGWSAAGAGEELGGMVLLKPTSIDYTGIAGHSASINTDGSVTYDGVSSLSLNGVFSADYRNYLMVTELIFYSSSAPLRARLRDSGGSDALGGNYTNQALYTSGATLAASRDTGTDQCEIGYVSAGSRVNAYTTRIYSPYLSETTLFRTTGMNAFSGGVEKYDYAGQHAVASSYPSLTIFPNIYYIYGTVAMYGLVGA